MKELTKDEVYSGMKIKMALPTCWCQVRERSPYVWLKGTILEANEKSIVVNLWNKKHKFHIERMFCVIKDFKRDKTYSIISIIISVLVIIGAVLFIASAFLLPTMV